MNADRAAEDWGCRFGGQQCFTYRHSVIRRFAIVLYRWRGFSFRIVDCRSRRYDPTCCPVLATRPGSPMYSATVVPLDHCSRGWCSLCRVGCEVRVVPFKITHRSPSASNSPPCSQRSTVLQITELKYVVAERIDIHE